jgi:hypothetical protein
MSSNKLFQLPQPSSVPSSSLATVEDARRHDDTIAAVAAVTPALGELQAEEQQHLRDFGARTRTIRQAASVRLLGSVLVGACVTLTLGVGAGILFAGGVVLWQKVVA